MASFQLAVSTSVVREKLLSDEEWERLKKLEKENAALKKRLEQAEAIIDLQKKIAKILDLDRDESNGSKQ